MYISKESNLVTLINVFETTPEQHTPSQGIFQPSPMRWCIVSPRFMDVASFLAWEAKRRYTILWSCLRRGRR